MQVQAWFYLLLLARVRVYHTTYVVDRHTSDDGNESRNKTRHSLDPTGKAGNEEKSSGTSLGVGEGKQEDVLLLRAGPNPGRRKSLHLVSNNHTTGIHSPARHSVSPRIRQALGRTHPEGVVVVFKLNRCLGRHLFSLQK